jgi:hypothetical protein
VIWNRRVTIGLAATTPTCRRGIGIQLQIPVALAFKLGTGANLAPVPVTQMRR